MTEIPEHLLKRSQERRKALGLSGGEGEGGDAAPEETPAAVGEAPAEEAAAPAAAAGPDPNAITEDKGGVPAHLLERSRRRKAVLSGDAPAAGVSSGAASPPSPSPPDKPSALRRSWLRLRRCSGISVIGVASLRACA